MVSTPAIPPFTGTLTAPLPGMGQPVPVLPEAGQPVPPQASTVTKPPSPGGR
jgi:hypothetical protein